ncbi:MAG: ribonuclease D [Capsulimonadaceae bacterium]
MAFDPVVTEREMVRTSEGLAALVQELRDAGRFALDTEFAGERTYVPRLCLVQVATEKFIGLIDAVAVPDLSPLWALVGDPSIEKVLHAAREDLRIAYYGGLKLIPRGVFDTQVAAGLVGLSLYPLSYARLVEAMMGVRLTKTETRSDWERRPLSPEQVRYARDDVRYLLPIASRLSRLLEKLGRGTWLSEEMERFSDPGVYEPDPEEAYLRVRGPRQGLTARPTAILRAIASWREREAALRNTPARAVLRDEVMTEIALRSPRRLGDLSRMKSFPAGEESTLGPPLLAAVEAARAIPESELPSALVGQEEDTPQQRILIDTVAVLGAALCLSRNIAPELALTKASAAELVRNGAGTGAALLTGWRAQAVGRELADVLLGKASVHAHVSGGELSVTITAPE